MELLLLKTFQFFAFQQRATNKEHFLIRPLVSEHHEALALLGVQNASVLLAQCGVWVEGVTDRVYLRAYLKAYQESDEFRKAKLPVLREDTHYAFWEYAGSNLGHYLMSGLPRRGTPEAEDYEQGEKDILSNIQSSALCNRIFLLADRDNQKDKKHEALKNIARNRSNFLYYVPSCIEVENLLSPKELNKCLPEFFQRKMDASKAIPLLPAAISSKDYKKIRMGEFLRTQFPAIMPAKWEAEGGTLITTRKTRLCEIATKYIKWETMSLDAQQLIKSLYQFLAEHNKI